MARRDPDEVPQDVVLAQSLSQIVAALQSLEERLKGIESQLSLIAEALVPLSYP